jgi:tRNA pseudouridine38-40 synthase
MRNIKLILEYDGSAYHGWQVQNNAITVQSVIQDAIFRITGEKCTVTGCGRTDAGVHARAYVCNFKTESKIPAERLSYALNSVLPNDIVCKGSSQASLEFDAKRSAVSKRYTYLIYNSEFPNVFLQNRAWHFKYPLDVEAMSLGAKCFEGEHDFIGFASSGFTVKTTVRTVYKAEVKKENDIIAVDISGNGFLYNMVRIIAGTLVFCGSGKINRHDLPEIIASKDRTRAGITAPACGLYLSEVTYK